MSTLGFPSTPGSYANVDIGNERFNVFVGTCPMTYPASSFKNILLFFDPNETDPSKIDKVIIYIDNVNNVTRAVIALYDWLHPSLQEKMVVMPVHAWMTPEYRSEAMAKFASGEVRIIVATEAAGMGCDISDIKRVIQFGICSSIDAFMQRIGRVWRGSDGTGEGWLIYEKWVPKCKKHTGPSDKGKVSSNNKKSSVPDDNSSKASTKNERKCDLLVQQLVLEPVCRRRYLNRVYGNPKSKTVVPPHECCDICDPNSATRIPDRKFPTERGPPRAARASGDSSPAMLSCLRAWRRKTFLSIFGRSSMFGASALIGDDQLERISRCAPVPSIQRLKAYLVKWPGVESHLDSMWEALKAGGFALPVESAETAAPKSTPTSRPQPTPGPSTDKTSRKSSKRRHAEESEPKPQSQAAQGSSSAQQPAADTWSWSAYAGAHNHEVRQSTMDDLRRLLTGQAGAQSHEESVQGTRPSTPSPTAKRPRLESHSASRQGSRKPPPAPRASSALPPTASTTILTTQTPVRLITPPIVPSQRACSPAAKHTRLNHRDVTGQAPCALPPAPHVNRMLPPATPIAPSTFQAPAKPVGRMVVPSQRLGFSSAQASFGNLRRQPLYTAPVARQHPYQPSPVPASRFAYFGIPYFRPLPPHIPVLYRPPGPPPCNLAFNLVNPPPSRP